MKKFLGKLFIYITLCILVLLLFNHLYVHTNYWKAENNINKFINVPYDIQLCNLGNSHGNYGFKYDDNIYNIKAWNFAMDSQSYFYDYLMLQKYEKHLRKNAIVLIPISYCGISRRPDYSPIKKRYYRIFSRTELEKWSFFEFMIYEKLPIITASNNKFRIFRDISTEQMNPYYNREKFLNDDDLYSYCIKRYEDWNKPYDEQGIEGYQKNMTEVSKIVDFCYIHELTPVLISTPITDVLNQIYYEKDPAFFIKFEQFSQDLCKKYSNLSYYDYSRDEHFSCNHTYFTDGDHLNNKGAEAFTNNVLKRLKEELLIP